jgi:Cd2+/Zn2+-exporting ATPase
MDKTGTLTEGRFRVSQLCPNGISETELLSAAAALESHSTHPLSRSICEHAGVTDPNAAVRNTREIAGRGIVAEYDGKTALAGNGRLMQEMGINVPEVQGTAVYVARDGQYLGAIRLCDQPKAAAKEAMAALRRQGADQLVMLTGDSRETAEEVAALLALDRVHAELLPDGKIARLEELLAQKPAGKSVVFVGDGINDAPVLTRADVGVAMGAMGSDAAVEAADMVLMDDDPRKLSTAIGISCKTMRIARQNIAFALGIKAAVLLLAALGIANMWLAVFADVGVSILAVLNAMRTLRYRENHQSSK